MESRQGNKGSGNACHSVLNSSVTGTAILASCPKPLNPNKSQACDTHNQHTLSIKPQHKTTNMTVTTRSRTGKHPIQMNKYFHDKRLSERVTKYQALKRIWAADDAKTAGKKMQSKAIEKEATDKELVWVTANRWSCCHDATQNYTSAVWCRNCNHYTVNCLEVCMTWLTPGCVLVSGCNQHLGAFVQLLTPNLFQCFTY